MYMYITLLEYIYFIIQRLCCNAKVLICGRIFDSCTFRYKVDMLLHGTCSFSGSYPDNMISEHDFWYWNYHADVSHGTNGDL